MRMVLNSSGISRRLENVDVHEARKELCKIFCVIPFVRGAAQQR